MPIDFITKRRENALSERRSPARGNYSSGLFDQTVTARHRCISSEMWSMASISSIYLCGGSRLAGIITLSPTMGG
jgi:hypothetical protein